MVANRRGPRRGGVPPLVKLDEPSRGLWDDDLSDVAEALLGSAALCFAAKGFHATRTRDITSQLGLTPGALYVHFSTKEDVLFEIVHTCHQRALERLGDALDPSGAPEMRLRQAVAAFVEWHAENHTAARVCQYELSSLSPKHYAAVLGLRSQFNEIFRDAVRRLAGGDTPEADVNRVTRAILSLGVDLVRWYRLGDPDTPASLGAFYAELAVQMTVAVRTGDPSPP